MGIIYGSIIGVIKGDTRSLDYSSDKKSPSIWEPIGGPLLLFGSLMTPGEGGLFGVGKARSGRAIEVICGRVQGCLEEKLDKGFQLNS